MRDDDLVDHPVPVPLEFGVVGGHRPVADAVAAIPGLGFEVDLFLLLAGQPLDEGVGEVEHLLDEGRVGPEVGVRIEGVVAPAPSRHLALDVGVKVADPDALVVVVGAVDRHEDRRQRPLDPRGGVVEEHRMVQHALAEFGQHVLQHRGPRADQVHPVIAEIAPDQRLRPQRQGIDASVRRSPPTRSCETVLQISNFVPTVTGVMPVALGRRCRHILDSLYFRKPRSAGGSV